MDSRLRIRRLTKQPSRSRIIVLALLALGCILGLVNGAAAQSDRVLLIITRVESQAFPQVSVWTVVSDEAGPLDGLTTADFQLVEDGLAVPTTPIKVEPETRQDLRLVLALDVSMPENDLAKVKTAANALINALSSRDKMALITLANEAKIAREFTNNAEELRAVVEDLTPGGDLTASHMALDEAITLLEQLDTGCRAVVVVTDSRDNTGSRAVDELIDRAWTARIPLYVFGFGNKVRTDPLKEQIGLTTGQYLTLSGSDEVQEALLELGERLGQGYKLTFLSNLKADDAEHNLSITVLHPGGESQTTGRFTAKRGQVTVQVPNLTEGQTVAGLVKLTPKIKAPAPLVSVRYLLDDKLLETVEAPPYFFEWDSTTVPVDSHTLVVRAVDQAGNQGQAELNLKVAVPVKVAISTPRTELVLGEGVTIQTKVETVEELATLELWLDGQLVDSRDEPPYSFPLDSSQYQAGAHDITIRAEDKLGREATDSLTLQFKAPPVPEPPLWRRLVAQGGRYLVTGAPWMVAGLFILAVAILGLVITARIQKRGQQTIFHLELANLGNIPTAYQLQAEEAQGALRFQFAQKGINLPQPPVSQAVEAAPAGGEFAASHPVISTTPAYPARGQTGQAMEQVRSAGAGAKGCAMAIAGILSTLGYLLPGSAGRSVRQLGQNISAGQSRVDRVAHAPRRMARTAGQLQQQVAQVTPAASRAGSSIRAAEARTGTGPAETRVAPATTKAGSRRPVAANGRQAMINFWAQTPLVEPGETLGLELLITPIRKPYRTRSYSFQVHSRVIEADGDLVTEAGTVKIKGVSRLRRLVPYAIFVMLMVILVWGVYDLLLNLEVGQYLWERLSSLIQVTAN